MNINIKSEFTRYLNQYSSLNGNTKGFTWQVKPGNTGTFQTPSYFLRSFRKIKPYLEQYLTKDFRYDWLFKQWNSIHNLSHFVPMQKRFRIQNFKTVSQACKMVRIPRTEPFLKQLFEDRYNITLPSDNPVSAQDVTLSDFACFDRYESNKQFKINNAEAFYRALDKTLIMSGFMQKVPFKLKSIDEAIKSLPSNTSSCYPTMGKKNTEEALTYAKSFVKKMLSLRNNPYAMMNILYSHFCVVFHRVQVVVENLKPFGATTKVRQVFGVPFGILILEVMLFGNFIRTASRSSKVFTMGLTRLQVSDLIKKLRAKNFQYVVCGDFSKFDSTIPPQLIELYYSGLIQCSGLPERYKSLASCLSFWSTFTPFMGKDLNVRYMLGGNVSGSFLTSALNSFVSCFVINYAYYRYFGSFPSENDLFILGDDFILGINDKGFLKFLAAEFKNFNIILNVSKTRVADSSNQDDITFLGFNWNLLSEPDQSLEWICAHTVFPERTIEGISGYDRVLARMCSVIFQIKSGPVFFDRFIFYSNKKLQKQLVESNYKLKIRLVKDDGMLSNIVIPFDTFYHANWTLF
uniref:RNA-dependent RNA polymerase-like protein n=1 Tax=Bryopsis cinicola TaxID=74789 RepID=Q95FY6_9CHLO|nr:RNA-dependent RNA polymerase-like protein [Bryopsis cinicola]